MSGPDRRADLAEALARVEARIAAACSAAGRGRDEVRWVAVSKSWPASDVAALHELGVRQFGENKDQEAAVKAKELARLEISWHFVGQLQTNKARSVASYAAVVHTLDRAKLARALSDAAQRSGRTLDVLVQVSLDGDVRRGGVPAEEVPPLAELTMGLPGLRLGGLMAVAPRAADPGAAFDALAGLSADLRTTAPEAREISAGMSGDLEAAVNSGATLLRVGTALFGHRTPPLR